MSFSTFKLSTAKTVLAGVTVGLIGFAAAVLPGSVATAQQAQTPAQLFQDKCSACHNLPDPQTNTMTAVGWQRTVDRMMVQHGASDSITADQAKTIVAYLDTFAVKPQRQGIGGGGLDATDVWASAPTYSHAYVFASNDAVSQLQTLSGRRAFRASDPASDKQLILAAADGGSGLLAAHLPTLSNGTAPARDIQVEADFKAAPPAPGDKTSAPVSFGLAFDITSPTVYRAVTYDDAKHAITITTVNNGTATVDQTIPLQAGLGTTPDSWHHMKVIVVGGAIKIWLDYMKYPATATTDPASAGDVGLWSGGRAVAKSLIVDVYSPVAPANALQ